VKLQPADGAVPGYTNRALVKPVTIFLVGHIAFILVVAALVAAL
jgi:hypothetical protein